MVQVQSGLRFRPTAGETRSYLEGIAHLTVQSSFVTVTRRMEGLDQATRRDRRGPRKLAPRENVANAFALSLPKALVTCTFGYLEL